MPDYGKNRPGTLTRQALDYWAREYRRLRIGHLLGISFDTFLRLKRRVRLNVHRWAHDILGDWRDNPRWMRLSGTKCVLDWTADAPTDAEATLDPDVADLRKIRPN